MTSKPIMKVSRFTTPSEKIMAAECGLLFFLWQLPILKPIYFLMLKLPSMMLLAFVERMYRIMRNEAVTNCHGFIVLLHI